MDLGPSGTFLVARGTVEKERLNSTLAKAVGSGLLDDTWQEWKRSAVVEVALPLPALRRPRRGQTYTFLPMGENLAAPFPGHMNAPFFTKSADQRMPFHDHGRGPDRPRRQSIRYCAWLLHSELLAACCAAYVTIRSSRVRARME